MKRAPNPMWKYWSFKYLNLKKISFSLFSTSIIHSKRNAAHSMVVNRVILKKKIILLNHQLFVANGLSVFSMIRNDVMKWPFNSVAISMKFSWWSGFSIGSNFSIWSYFSISSLSIVFFEDLQKKSYFCQKAFFHGENLCLILFDVFVTYLTAAI